MNEAMSGWRSSYEAAPAQLLHQRTALLTLIGQRLVNGWVGWDPARDLWQPVFPVVLLFDSGAQLELAWQGWDDLSITWNTIDLSIPPTLLGRPYEWRRSQPPAMAVVEDQVLTAWTVTEDPYFPGETDLTGDLPMDKVKGWLTNGLLLRFTNTSLHIYNGADTTLVSAGYDPPTRIAHR